jgi:hypothetical protein
MHWQSQGKLGSEVMPCAKLFQTRCPFFVIVRLI